MLLLLPLLPTLGQLRLLKAFHLQVEQVESESCSLAGTHMPAHWNPRHGLRTVTQKSRCSFHNNSVLTGQNAVGRGKRRMSMMKVADSVGCTDPLVTDTQKQRKTGWMDAALAASARC